MTGWAGNSDPLPNHVARLSADRDDIDLTIPAMREADRAFEAFLDDSTKLPEFLRQQDGFAGQWQLQGSFNTVLLGSKRSQYVGEVLLPDAAATLGEVKERVASLIPGIMRGFKQEKVGQFSGVIGDPDNGKPLYQFTDDQWLQLQAWVENAFAAGINALNQDKLRAY